MKRPVECGVLCLDVPDSFFRCHASGLDHGGLRLTIESVPDQQDLEVRRLRVAVDAGIQQVLGRIRLDIDSAAAHHMRSSSPSSTSSKSSAPAL